MKKGEEFETIVIDNFYGPLTRKVNGDMRSGLAKFNTSFGYDPFTKPGNLTWFEQPASIVGISDLIVDAKPRFEVSNNFIYALGNTGKLYKIQPNSVTSPNLDSVIGIASVTAGGNTYNFGGSLEFYGSTEKIYAGGDKTVNSINFDGTAETIIGSAANYSANKYRALTQFIGYLAFGNGTNIGLIDSTGTVVSSVVSSHYEQLSPTLPPETNVTDLDVSVDGNYLNITASGVANENIATVSSDRQAAAGSKGAVYYWNGVDQGVTSFKTIPSYAVTAMQVYLDSNNFFENDSFGASISNGSTKIVSLPNVKSPFANATTTNGNFLSWISPELSQDGTMIAASMFYFGQLDQDNPKGMWRIMKYSPTIANGFIYQTPVNLMTNNKYSTVNNSVSSVTTLGYGKHYLSTFEVNSTNTTVSGTTAKLLRFLVTSTGTGTPQAGVYETQTQLFSRKVSPNEIRVYTEPTVSGNGFQIDLIGSDGNPITNATFTYTFQAGTDPTLLQGSFDRINFSPNTQPVYAIGVRITNTGTKNMVFKKVELDIAPAGK